jgi:hypothetical protein
VTPVVSSITVSTAAGVASRSITVSGRTVEGFSSSWLSGACIDASIPSGLVLVELLEVVTLSELVEVRKCKGTRRQRGKRYQSNAPTVAKGIARPAGNVR